MEDIMKRLLVTFIVLLVALQLSAQDRKPARADLALGSPMPSFTIESSTYGKISSSDLKGKVVLINLFATWCPPCQQELAQVQKILWPKYKDNSNFRMLVLGREHTDADLEKYNQKKGFTFPLYPDPARGVFSKFADQTIPRTYLYGKDGKLVYSATGYSPEEFAKLMDAIERALK